MTKIDFEKSENFKKNKDCHLGFSTESILRDLKKKDLVNDKGFQNFYENPRKCVAKTMQKMCERCPLASVIVRNAVVFDPVAMASSKEALLLKKIKLLLQHLVILKVLPTHKADKAFLQYIVKI